MFEKFDEFEAYLPKMGIWKECVFAFSVVMAPSVIFGCSDIAGRPRLTGILAIYAHFSVDSWIKDGDGIFPRGHVVYCG